LFFLAIRSSFLLYLFYLFIYFLQRIIMLYFSCDKETSTFALCYFGGGSMREGCVHFICVAN